MKRVREGKKLTVMGKPDWKTLRKELKDQENNNDLSKYPNLVVKLDELTHTMAMLYNLDSSEKLDELREVLETLTICWKVLVYIYQLWGNELSTHLYQLK